MVRSCRWTPVVSEVLGTIFQSSEALMTVVSLSSSAMVGDESSVMEPAVCRVSGTHGSFWSSAAVLRSSSRML
jgi:hypothetical protein